MQHQERDFSRLPFECISIEVTHACIAYSVHELILNLKVIPGL